MSPYLVMRPQTGLTRNTENIRSRQILEKAANDDPKLGDAVDVESDFHDCFGRWWEDEMDEVEDDLFENTNHMKYQEENDCKVTWKNPTGNGDLTLDNVCHDTLAFYQKKLLSEKCEIMREAGWERSLTSFI